MPALESLQRLLSQPTPANLWPLRSDLLQAGTGEESRLLAVVDAFFHFTNALYASTSARNYSHLASLMDMGAVGSVVTQNLLQSRGPELWQRLLTGGLSEGLMVLAARQYVRAAEMEVGADLEEAAWTLFAELWHLSGRLQPEMPAEERRQRLEQLLAPARNPQARAVDKAVFLGRLFQLLLLIHWQLASGPE